MYISTGIKLPNQHVALSNKTKTRVVAKHNNISLFVLLLMSCGIYTSSITDEGVKMSNKIDVAWQRHCHVSRCIQLALTSPRSTKYVHCRADWDDLPVKVLSIMHR